MTPKAVMEKLIGKWDGISRVWFEPGKVEDESQVSGEFSAVFDGRAVCHRYRGSMKGKGRRGEEIIASNSNSNAVQMSWVDEFHMNYAILFSQGKATDRGFSVVGEYDVGEDQPKWRWRTEYVLHDDDHLTITAYNIQPGEAEQKAVETTYHRVK